MMQLKTLLDQASKIMGEGRCGALHCFGPTTVTMDTSVLDPATGNSIPTAAGIPLCEIHANTVDVLKHHLDDSAMMQFIFELVDWER